MIALHKIDFIRIIYYGENMNDFEHMICPVCRKPLSRINQSLACASGHSFDIAGKGYVNLLLSQDKSSRDPGDNKDMVRARKRFLDKGYYEPLAKGLSQIFTQLPNKNKENCMILDAGCGDGYYTDHLYGSLKQNFSSSNIYGMDISKEAIRLAAGRNKDICFLVASLFKLPFADNTADFILNAFAPSSDEEFNRVLKKDGCLITVIPGKDHLFELKSVLYENPYKNDEKEPDLPSFKEAEQVRIKSAIKIGSNADLKDLLTMTPYNWRTPRAGIERLSKLESLETDIEFIIGIHEKA
jgi:23S rRNA (guanine745-N1)-methyltransferase